MRSFSDRGDGLQSWEDIPLKGFGGKWHHHQVQTLRWKLYETAAKTIYHGRYIYLKVIRYLVKLFTQIWEKSWEYIQGWI